MADQLVEDPGAQAVTDDVRERSKLENAALRRDGTS
jgi:hypothetical protein